jgi:hypothetical protein
VVVLTIQNCGLDSIGPEIMFLKQLQELNLSDNQIRVLDELFNLTQIIKLDLTHNRLETLNNRVSRLDSLEVLLLGNNRLSTLPYDSLFILPKIKVINVFSNFIDIQNITRERLSFAQSICSGLSQQKLPNKLIITDQFKREAQSKSISKDKIESENRLFIGSWEATTDIDLLKSLGITHILSIGPNPSDQVRKDDYFHRFHIDIADIPSEDVKTKFDDGRSLKFIDDGTSQNKSCLSRSSTFIIAWLVSRFQISLDEALAILKRTRYCTRPNSGFINQISEWIQSSTTHKVPQNSLPVQLISTTCPSVFSIFPSASTLDTFFSSTSTTILSNSFTK